MSTITPTAPAPLQFTHKIEIDLEPQAAWKLIHDYGRVQDWHPGVANTEIISGINNQPGAVRRLTFLDGKTIETELISHEPQHLRLSYTITVSNQLPVSNYRATLSVLPSSDDKKSWVSWQSHFSRADPSAEPAAGQDDRAAIDAVTGIYTSGLDSLVKIAADQVAIRKIIAFYAEGGTRGDVETVARAFHPSATLKFVQDTRLVDEPIERYYKNYIKAGVLQQRTVVIDYINIKGTAAATRLTIDYSTHQFTDYFNLLKIDGAWQVVGKIATRLEKP